MRIFLLVILSSITLPVSAQRLTSEEIHRLADGNFQNGMQTLREFLSIPNWGKSEADINANVAWCEKSFQSIGFQTEVLVSDGVKHVFAERVFRKGAPNILFYMQIDGQPVDSSEWFQESPFIPALKDCSGADCKEISWDRLKDWNPDWKVFARSVSDSKGPGMAFFQALKILNDKKIKPAFNIKVIMDFQEELGSPTLPPLIESNREKFKADALLIMDGTRPPGNLPTLTFGARGIATIKLTVFGAKVDLHSGQYGNYSPNPVFHLARLLGAMKDDEGRVLIPGYYDGVNLTEEQKRLINQVPDDKEELVETLGIAKPEAVGETYQEALQYPSLNVRGLKAAWVEENVRTIIPAEAMAEIDMRLVLETPAQRQIDLVTDFIRNQGFEVIDHDPTDEERARYPKLIKVESRIGSLPFKTDLNSPLGIWLGDAMEYVFGEGNYVRTQATGGSQPIAPFINTLDIPAISIRIPNPDNSIHAPNENLRLGNFHEGIMMCLGILTRKYE